MRDNYKPFYFFDTKLPVFETIGVQCNKCFSDLYILWDCFKYSARVPLNYRGYKVKPLRSRATSAEDCSEICKCGNVGIVKDEDNDLHVYVDDIRTVSMHTYYISTIPERTYIYRSCGSAEAEPITTDYRIVYKSKIGHSESFLYVDYTPIHNTLLQSKPKYVNAVRKDKPRDLLWALKHYKNFYANKHHTLPGIAK